MTEAEAEVEAARIQARERQYATYVEWAEKLIERRAEAHRFYVTLNLAIVGAIGFLFSEHFNAAEGAPPADWMAAALAFAGVMVSWNWRSVVASQRRIMAWKFDIVHRLEAQLPSQPYKDEWDVSQTARRKSSAGRFELRLPSLFMAFFALALILTLASAVTLDAAILYDRLRGVLPAS
jgi:hypothetical protein